MTLSEAIKHAEEVANNKFCDGEFECYEEHRQLAAWLRELKAIKEHNKWDTI